MELTPINKFTSVNTQLRPGSDSINKYVVWRNLRTR